MMQKQQWRRLAVMALLSGGPSLAAAQTGTPAIAEVDTTIQPGHRDFSRYDIPSACMQAVILATTVARRADIDTALYNPDRDTLPSAAVTIARRCSEKFSAATVPQRELVSLIQLALAAGRDDVARAASDRLSSLIANPTEKGWALYAIVNAYVGARPSRVADAERVIARMDSLGKAAIAPRSNAHGLMLQDADMRFDVQRIEREAMAMLGMDHEFRGEERNDATYGSGNAMFDLLWAQMYRDPQHAVDSVMRLAHDAGYHWATDTMSVRQYLTTVVMPMGHQPPAVNPKFWFGAHGASNWPVPGKLTLLLSEPSAGGNYAMYAMLRRLHQKYGDALNLTIVTRAVGYIHDSSPLQPAQEADSLRSYYHDFLKLPVSVGVEELAFDRLPDGRRINRPSPMDQIGLYGFTPLLVDQSGRLIIIGERTQAGLEAFIDKTLRQPAVSSAK